MNKVIVIVGPTGVGKTKLSISLAKRYHGEIINADSTQIYRGLNIGTAKISEEEKEKIPHHLFDIKNVDEEYSIYHYQKDCRKKIEEIIARGNVPILVGGTGLYMKSALYDYQLEERIENDTNYDLISTEELYQKLVQMDPEIRGKIDKNNRRRIINAIRYYKKNKTSITQNKTNILLYDAIFIGLTTERENLYQRINYRVEQMINNGLLDEVYSFYQKNIFTKPLLAAIGYKELYAYFRKEVSFMEAVENIKKNSRRYAKRQYTFFNHQLPVVWFQTDYSCFQNTVEDVCKYLDKL